MLARSAQGVSRVMRVMVFMLAVVSIKTLAHSGAVPVRAVEASLVAVQHNAYLMTRPGAANTSHLHIINTSDESQQFYGTLYEKDGNQLGEEETLLTPTAISPYGRAIMTSEELSDLFGETWTGPAMLEVYGASSFTTMIRLTSPSGLISNTNCVTEDVVHNLDGFDTTDRGFVRFFNTGTTTISDIRGTMYDVDGNVIGTADQQLLASLGPKNQTFLNRGDLATIFGTQWNGNASLYVSDKDNLKLLLVTFITDQSTFFNFSCLEGQADLTNPVTPSSEPQTLDITDSIFTERSADCATYANTYFANVNDVQRSQAFQADVTVSDDGSSCTLSSDGIPNHDFNAGPANFATAVAEVDRSFNITRSPAIASSSTALSQSTYNAIMLNGVVLDLLSAGCYNPDDPMADADGNTTTGCMASDPWLIDPLGTDNKFGADSHNAHTQPDGTYHYHGNPNAMFDDNPGSSGSPVIGFAADGFPIYGSYFLDPATDIVRKAVSGYTLKSGSRGTQSDTNPGGNYDGTYVDDYEFTDAGDLDACNGMTVNGQYGYYVIDSFPWVMRCISGTPDSSFNKN